MKFIKQFIVVLVVSLFMQISLQPASADVSACSGNVSPAILSDTGDVTFLIENSDVVTYNWIRITRPSSNFVIDSVAASGWNVQSEDDTITLSDGAIFPGDSLNVVVGITPEVEQLDPQYWNIYVSDDGGDTSTFCSGTFYIEIGQQQDETAPQISDVVISNITSSQAKITWTTNESADSKVDYGITDSYGSTESDGSMVSSHTLTLTNLSAETTYNLRITSTDTDSNAVSSNNITFTTAEVGEAAQTITVTTTTTTTTTRTITPTPTPTPLPDTTPPSVTIVSKFDKPVAKSPQIIGLASDAKGVEKVEYSTDNGKNWIPIETIKSGTKVSVSFIPDIVDDGNYAVLLRATDLYGNRGVSRVTDLIIDRLPPQVGATIISLGPQPMRQETSGRIFSIAGVTHNIALSAVGGPTSVDLLINKKVFSLQRNSDNGLWTGTFSFAQPGMYQLKSLSIDGAKNIVEQNLDTITVMPLGKILSQEKEDLLGATVQVFYQDVNSKSWKLWDAGAYGQKNPQEGTRYGYYLPKGTYYLKVTAPGYTPAFSDVFSLSQPAAITSGVTLEKRSVLRLWKFVIPLPDFSFSSFAVDLPEVNKKESNTTNSPAPLFSLPSVTGENVSLSSMRGKNTVISFISTWSPQSIEQIALYDSASAEREYNHVFIVPQETPSVVSTFQKRGKYSAPILVDADGTTVKDYKLTSIPTHYFLDQSGTIRNIITGVLNSEELAQMVLDLDN